MDWDDYFRQQAAMYRQLAEKTEDILVRILFPTTAVGLALVAESHGLGLLNVLVLPAWIDWTSPPRSITCVSPRSFRW
jgi:hypothetical protein